MEGSFLASPGAVLWGSTRAPFPSPGFTVPMGSGPSKLLQAFRPQPEFLHRSRFFSFVILTGQFSDIFPSAGSASRADMHYLSSQHCPSPGTSRGCTNACQPCSFFPQFLFHSRCLAGPLGAVHSAYCTVERNPSFSRVGDGCGAVGSYRGVCAILLQVFWGQGYLVPS